MDLAKQAGLDLNFVSLEQAAGHNMTLTFESQNSQTPCSFLCNTIKMFLT